MTSIVTIEPPLTEGIKASRQPTPYDLERIIKECGLETADPNQGPGQPVGKAKRMRTVLLHALEHDRPAGQQLLRKLVTVVRSDGGSRESSDNYVTRHFVRLIEEFEPHGYLVNAFGQKCVDDQSPRPDPSAVLERRLGYDVFGWPLESSRAGWEVDDFYDLVEVLHDLVARPSRRWYHDESGCGWHYGGFATRPARRLYRWQVNRLLVGSDLDLRLAEEGEDLGRQSPLPDRQCPVSVDLVRRRTPDLGRTSWSETRPP